MRKLHFGHFISVFLLFASGITGADQASAQCLGYAAIALEPWLPAIKSDAYLQVAGRVKHKGNSTDKIVLFGPVFSHTGSNRVNWNRFIMFYKDPDGTGSASRVQASLGYLDASGNVRNVATLDSDQHLPSSTGVREMSVAFNHTFNFFRNYYYVQITVTRSNPNLDPEILGFKICE